MESNKFDKKIWEVVAQKFNLDIQFNFTLSNGNHEETFEVLLKGYGAQQGMIIDQSYYKINKMQNYILEKGFGFSCFKLDSVEGFQEVLKDWGLNKKA